MATQIADYEVLGRLGTGGMGDVLRVRDPQGRELALKLPSGELNDRQLERFQREGQLTARLRHPGIVAVHGAGTHEGRPYLVYELVEGVELGACLDQMDRARRLQVLASVAEALGHAHRAGVVHRDLKPANILIDQHGQPRVTDFGLARSQDLDRLTRSGTLVGTLYTMAPEQVAGAPGEQGPHTDVWALGVLLYQMLTDRQPFDGTLGELMTRIASLDPTPPRRWDPSVPPAVEAVCLRALAKSPARRYSDADAFAAALREALRGRLSPERALGRPAWALLLLLVVLGAGLAAAWRGRPAGGPAAVSPAPAVRVARGELDLASRWEDARRAEEGGRPEALAELARRAPPEAAHALQELLLAEGLARLRSRAGPGVEPVLAALAARPLAPGDQAGAALADALVARVIEVFSEDGGLERGLQLLERAAGTGIRVGDGAAAIRASDAAFNARIFDTLSGRQYWRYMTAAVQLDVPLASKHVSTEARVSLGDRPRVSGAAAAWLDYVTQRYRSTLRDAVGETALRALLRLIRDPHPPLALGPLNWAEVAGSVVWVAPEGEQQALLDEAARRSPRDPWVWLRRSRWSLERGRYPEARRSGERAVQLYDQLDYGSLVSLTYARAFFYEQLVFVELEAGDRQQARRRYQLLKGIGAGPARRLAEANPWLEDDASAETTR